MRYVEEPQLLRYHAGERYREHQVPRSRPPRMYIHAHLAAVAPLIQVRRPSFYWVSPGMRSIHPHKWHSPGYALYPSTCADE